MNEKRPIGLFDSGVGGLTVSRHIFRYLPEESTIYFGDNARVPYGSRSREELMTFAAQILTFLLSRGAKYIIFACNTNSSLTLPAMRRRFGVPMIGLIEPGAAEAARVTRRGRVGVIATEATVKSGAYQAALKAAAPGLEVFAQAAPRLVPLVEGGRFGTRESLEAVREYVEPLKKAGIDTLILGCTHYPFLWEEFRTALGPEVVLVDPAEATVKAAREELARLGLLGGPGGPVEHRYYVSGDPLPLVAAARRFLGLDGVRVEKVTLD
ncbi:glutamate racemase [Desulfovirgula thermocuniculi]|uniref:glutamate racemase n=1 Tax=Desulfovirgula thermocuniculi TaxID=348842 RepID=UPI0004149B35|nr:glutamate racemase [Desulfovirgula thermocuniculi]